VAPDSEWQILTDYNRVHPPYNSASEIRDSFPYTTPPAGVQVPYYDGYYGDSVDTSHRQPVSSAGYNPYASYGSSNTAPTGDIQEALSERHENPTLYAVGEEGESREAGYDDIYEA
jgi:hypothetical protein